MNQASRNKPNAATEHQLSIQHPDHEPLISPQAAAALLRLIRNLNRHRTNSPDPQETP